MAKILLNLEELQLEKDEITLFLSSPNAYSDPDFPAKNRRLNELDNLISQASLRQKLEDQLSEARELANGNDELAEMAKQEIEEISLQLQKIENELFATLAPKDPNDSKNVIVEIRAGAGGDEASLFAAELYRMIVLGHHSQLLH